MGGMGRGKKSTSEGLDSFQGSPDPDRGAPTTGPTPPTASRHSKNPGRLWLRILDAQRPGE